MMSVVMKDAVRTELLMFMRLRSINTFSLRWSLFEAEILLSIALIYSASPIDFRAW